MLLSQSLNFKLDNLSKLVEEIAFPDMTDLTNERCIGDKTVPLAPQITDDSLKNYTESAAEGHECRAD